MRIFKLACVCLFLILMCMGLVAQQPAMAKDISGQWAGQLDVSGTKVHMLFTISQGADGQWRATMTVPEQGAKDLPCSRVTWEKASVTIEMEAAKIVFSGQLNEDFTEIAGTFKQGSFTTQLVCTRNKTFVPAVKKARPQDPQKPYPYLEEEVRCRNQKAGIVLAGTLTVPQGPGPFPAMVLITGSGLQDRNEEILNHRPFLVLADYLTRRGIAVLRLDDRGFGQSGGAAIVAQSTTFDFVDDIAAAVEFLRTRADIKADKIGLIGHSEGGCIAPVIAAQDQKIACIVMLAGLGTTGYECLLAQQQRGLELAGCSAAEIQQSVAMQKEILQIVLNEKDNRLAAPKLIKKLNEFKAGLSESLRAKIGADMDKMPVESQVNLLLLPWIRTFLHFDPAVYLKKVSCPVLAINGSKDCQVIAQDNLPAIAKWLKAGGNRNYTIKELPGLNHLFQTAQTGSVAEYEIIDETMAPAALELIATWIKTQTQVIN